jgi:hypothetical protein
MPWTPSWWAIVLAQALAERGHQVDLVLDGTETSPEPTAPYRVHIARPGRIHLGAHPGRFVRLVQSLRREQPQAVVLSLTPLLAGDLWLPVEPSPLQIARRLVRDLRPVSLALELAHHPWLGFEAWAAWRAGHPGATRLAFDATAGAEMLPRVTTLSQAQADAAHRASIDVRSSLSVPTGHALAVLSLPELNARVLSPFLSDLAAATARVSKPLTIVAATARPHTLARLAADAGLARLVPVTLSRSMHTLLAAADLALAPPPQAPPSAAGASGRWIADALALGVPVVAHKNAPGSDLIPQSVQAAWRTRDELAAALAHTLETSPGRTPVPTIPTHLSRDRLLERLEALAARIRPDQSAMVPPRAR